MLRKYITLWDIDQANVVGLPRNVGVGPILDDRLKEELLKPWKGAHSSHFRVCLSICVSVRPFAGYIDLLT